MSLPVTVFRTGDPVDAVWRGAIVVSSFLAVLVLYLFPAINHEYDARLGRDAARAPAELFDVDATDAQVSGAIAFWGARNDQVDGREVAVALFMPIGEPAQTPPGVSSWPGPGEVFASPEVLATTGGDELVARYGALVGVIDSTVLADRAERILYVGVDPELLEPPVYWNAISGFGIPVDPARGDVGVLGSAQYQSARSGAFLLALAFGLAPLLVLVVVLARLGGERRDSTVALLVALGASRAHLRTALWQTARAPIGIGVALATLLALVLNHVEWTVPYTGYVLSPSPDLRQLIALLTCCALGAVVTWTSLWVSTRPRSVMFMAARPTPRAHVASARPVLGLLAVLMAINWLYAFVNPSNPTFAAVILFVGVVVCILLLGPATSSILQFVASVVVRTSRRRGWPSALVVGRELTVMAQSAVRATIFMGVVALTSTFATVLATQPSEILRQAQAAAALNGGRSVSFEAPDTAGWLTQLASSLPDDEHLVKIVQGLAVDDLRLVAPCDAQEALLGACAGDGPTPLGSFADIVPAPLRAAGVSPSTIVETGEVSGGQMLVVSAETVPVDSAGLADELRSLVSPVPVITGPGDLWIVGAGVAVRQARWIVVVGAVACFFAVVMGCATILTEVTRMRRRHRVIAVYAGTYVRHLRLSVGLVGFPLVLGGVVGGAAGFLASYSAMRLGTASSSSAGSLLVVLLVVALTVASASSAAAALATARSASGRSISRAGHRP